MVIKRLTALEESQMINPDFKTSTRGHYYSKGINVLTKMTGVLHFLFYKGIHTAPGSSEGGVAVRRAVHTGGAIFSKLSNRTLFTDVSIPYGES